MKKKFRYVSSIVIAIMLVFEGLNVTAFAEESASINDSMIVMTDELAIQMAEQFSETAIQNIDLTADNPIKFYNETGQAIGYIVNYYDEDDSSCGYIIFDNSDDSLISEYSFGENVSNPYESIQETSDISVMKSDEDKLYKIAPFTYGIIDSESRNIIDNYGNESDATDIIAASDSEDKNPAEWDDVLIDVADVYVNYSLISTNNTSEFIAYSESYIESLTGHYACAVSALLACATYYGALNYSDIAGEYMELWDATSTAEIDDSDGSNGIIYGTTNIYNIGPGFVNYCADRGVSVSQSTVDSPTYNFFTNCIDGGNMAIVHCGIYSSSEGERVGHSMAVQGYATLYNYSSGETIHTFMVFDGWNTYVRYLNFDFENWTDLRGTSFNG